MLCQFGGRLQVKQLQNTLEPMRLILKEQPFLGGTTPNFADLAIAGCFAVCALPFTLKSATAYGLQQSMVFLSSFDLTGQLRFLRELDFAYLTELLACNEKL